MGQLDLRAEVSLCCQDDDGQHSVLPDALEYILTFPIRQSEVEQYQIRHVFTKLSQPGHYARSVTDTVSSVGQVESAETGDIWIVFDDKKVENGY